MELLEIKALILYKNNIQHDDYIYSNDQLDER